MNGRSYANKDLRVLPEKGGVFHWLMQRVTAVALIPLPFWMVFFIKHLSYSSHQQIVAWLSTPLNGVFLVFTALAAGYHAVLGLQSVFDDYVQRERCKSAAMWTVKLVFLSLLVTIMAAVLLIGSME